MNRLSFRGLAGLLFCLALFALTAPRGGAQANPDVTLTGRLLVVWHEAGGSQGAGPRVFLASDAGELTRLDLDASVAASREQLAAMDGARVTVRGKAVQAAAGQAPSSMTASALRLDAAG